MTHTAWRIGSVAFIVAGLLLLAGVALPQGAHAAPVIRSGETVALSEDQKVGGDFYIVAGTVSVSGQVEGDLYAAGGSVTINGPIQNDAVLAGGAVSVHGPISDDVRVAAGQVTIAEHIEGDLIVFAGTLSVLSTAQIDGDLLFYGGSAQVSGPVGGSIHTYSESMNIDAAVAGDVAATVREQLSLSPQAQIGGSIAYKSSEDLVRAPGSVVVGDISKSTLTQSVREASTNSIPAFRILVTLFAALVLLLIFGRAVERIVVAMHESTVYNALIGFGFLLLVPLAAGLLMVSVLGILVGLLTVLAYFLMLIVAWVLAGVFLGSLIARAVLKRRTVNFLWASIGVVALHAILLIPVLGPLAALLCALVALGSLAKLLYGTLRP